MNPYIYLLNGLPVNQPSGGSWVVASLTVTGNETVGGNLSVAGTALFGNNVTIQGSQTVMNANGANLLLSGAGTAQKFFEARNSGGDLYLGVESSVAGAFFPGSDAYGSVWYSPSNNSTFVTPSARFSGNLTVSGSIINGTTYLRQVINSGANYLNFDGGGSGTGDRLYTIGDFTLQANGAKSIYLVTNGVTALTLDSSQNATFTSTITASNTILSNKSLWSSGYTTAPADSTQRAILGVSGGTVYLQSLTGTVNSPLSIDGSSVSIRTGSYVTALTIDSSQRTILSGALRLNNAYTVGAVVSTGYVTIQDSTGTTYKVAVSL